MAAPARSASRRSSCPVSCALDLLGDRWTLLVIRDLFRGFTRFGEFLASPERIPTNILADRLKRLVASMRSVDRDQLDHMLTSGMLRPLGCSATKQPA